MKMQDNIQEVIFKNWALFTDCISKISNTQVDNAKYLDVVIAVYNLIEYSDNCSKISGNISETSLMILL